MGFDIDFPDVGLDAGFTGKINSKPDTLPP